jgi:hypothetical protein
VSAASDAARRPDADLGGEVRLGTMLFTLVEPHRGHEVAYNRWYERDHFYAGCLVGPWLFAGRRFVATQELKDLRFGNEPDLFGGLHLGSYLALYWILARKHRAHVDWAFRQVTWLHEHDRMFAERDHVHTVLYQLAERSDLPDAAGGPRGDLAGIEDVPAELALDHPYGGLVASLVRLHAGATPDDWAAWAAATYPRELELGFTAIPLPPNAPVTQQGQDRLDGCVMSLTFSAAAPDTWWDEQRAAADALERDGLGTMAWTAPFIPTVPGTDRYVDQLW